MGTNISVEHQRQIKEHLAKQDQLVEQLHSIVEQQARAIAALADDDADFEGEAEDLDGDDSGGEEFECIDRITSAALQKQKEPQIDEYESKMQDVQYVEPTEEEERNFAATKPWLGAMAPPTGWKKDSSLDDLPSVKLQLEHVHGYRARLCRNNVYWVDKDRILYFSAGVGVVHNLANNTQKFFLEHTDDILSIAYHKERRIVATGEQGKTPKICVWDVDTAQCLATMKGYHKRGVVSVAFSADGASLASVGLDDNHSIAVYDWQGSNAGSALLCESKGDSSRIVDVHFNFTKTADANCQFVTVGSKHIKFWTIAGSQLKAKKGLLGKRGKRQAFVTVTFNTDYTLVGTQCGAIYVFKGHKLSQSIPAHTGMVYCLRFVEGKMLSGGKDGAIIIWSADLKAERTVNMVEQEPTNAVLEPINSVRALDMLEGNILAGCITSTIYNIPQGALRPTMLTCGHFGNLRDKQAYGELWGLSASPDGTKYATAGEDSTLRIWDITTRKQIDRVELGSTALSCHWCPDGKFIAVGYSDGNFGVVEVETALETFKKLSRNRRIPCVKFSPCGKFLAVASASNVVDIYSRDGYNWNRSGTCRGASSVMLHVDWSKDSKWIQTVSQAYELLFYEQNGTFNPRSRQLKDEQWATQEATLGWNVQGIWPKYSDGSDVNMVNKSHNEKYLVSAEDSGFVKLFNYPCIGSGLDKRGKLRRRPKSHRHNGHSSHVTNVVFNANDTYVLSTGGGDLMTAQWKVVPAD